MLISNAILLPSISESLLLVVFVCFPLQPLVSFSGTSVLHDKSTCMGDIYSYQSNTPILCSSLISLTLGRFLPDFFTFLGECILTKLCIVFFSLDDPVSCASKLRLYSKGMITHTPCWTATFSLGYKLTTLTSWVLCTLKTCILGLKLILFCSTKAGALQN